MKKNIVWKALAVAFVSILVSVGTILTKVREALDLVFVIELVLLGMCGYGINQCNRKYDTNNGKMRIERWTMSMILADGITMFVTYALYAILTDLNEFSTNVNFQMTLIEVSFILLVAIWIYVRNYSRMVPEETVICSLKVRNQMNKKHRFVFLNQLTLSVEGKNICSGYVYGEIHVGEQVIIYQNGKQNRIVPVLSILADSKPVNIAQNKVVNIVFSNDVQIDQFAVISNVKEGFKLRPETFVENPVMEGLIVGWLPNRKNEKYSELFNECLLKGKYIVPVKIREGSGYGITKAPGALNIQGFPIISTAENAERQYMPVFTSWSELSQWKLLIENQDIATMVMSFMDIALFNKILSPGIVINPFSEHSATIEAEEVPALIEQYKKEKGE